MLTDIERKVLRIIINFHKSHGRLPNYDELMIKTGRDKNGVKRVLKDIERKMQIDWRYFDPGQVQTEHMPNQPKHWNNKDYV